MSSQPGFRTYRRTPPDTVFDSYATVVKKDTTIIGICGVADITLADPTDDGWFISDFFAFKHLLAGLGSQQTWLLGVSPGTIVERYTEYLHGSARQQRKVVLDQSILDEGSVYDNLSVVDPSQLLSKFLVEVGRPFTLEDNEDPSLLLLVFGHGEQDTHDIILGFNKLRQQTLADLLPPTTSRIAMITTACFSGGWAMSPQMDITTAYGATRHNFSFAWAQSESIGRSSGSVFASALIDTAVRSEAEQHPDGFGFRAPTLFNFSQMTRDSMESMNKNVFRFSGLTFSAQNDDWGASWCDRLGVPPCDAKAMWESLKTREPGGPTSAAEPGLSLATAHSQASQYPTGSTTARTPRGVLNTLRRLAEIEINSCPGSWAQGYGTHERAVLNRFLSNPCPTFKELDNMYTWLEFRQFCRTFAERLLLCIGISLEGFGECSKFDHEKWFMTNPCDERIGRYHHNYILLSEARFWPKPEEGQGQFWGYPLQFMAAVMADSLTEEDSVQKVAVIVQKCDGIALKIRQNAHNDDEERTLGVFAGH